MHYHPNPHILPSNCKFHHGHLETLDRQIRHLERRMCYHHCEDDKLYQDERIT